LTSNYCDHYIATAGGVRVKLSLRIALVAVIVPVVPEVQHPASAGQLAGFGLEAGTCGHCGGLEDMQHFFQRCPLVSDSWERLYFRLVGLLPGLPSDLELIMLAFPVAPVAVERLVVAHLGVFVAERWESHGLLRPPSRGDLLAAFRAHFPALRPLF
jgi:hypothetical protein